MKKRRTTGKLKPITSPTTAKIEKRIQALAPEAYGGPLYDYVGVLRSDGRAWQGFVFRRFNRGGGDRQGYDLIKVSGAKPGGAEAKGWLKERMKYFIDPTGHFTAAHRPTMLASHTVYLVSNGWTRARKVSL